MNTRQKVLEDALKIVNGEREKQYGSPEDNFARIADLWGLYLTQLFDGNGVVIELEPKDVALMMILFKIARSLGNEDKLDNYVDMIGYAACGAEIFEKEYKPKSNVQVVEACISKFQCKECDYAKKCVDTEVCLKEAEEALLDNKDPYSYAHDKLAHYVEIKAKEAHVPLDIDKLKEINRKFPRELSDYLHDAVRDCVENGKRFLDCYKEIDELFAKYVNKDKEQKESEG